MDHGNRGAAGYEEILDADQPICDAHHHLWIEHGVPYLLDDYRADTGSGHRIVSSVFVEVGTHYRDEGPELLRPVGETAWIAGQEHGDGLLAGIVGFADLRVGHAVDQVLAAHIDAGGGRFRGIRHGVAWDDDPRFWRSQAADGGTLSSPAFANGVRAVARAGLSFETWCYVRQLPQVEALAAAVPDIPVLVDHLGGPIRFGRDPRTTTDVGTELKGHLTRLASLDNVHLKLGGLGMTIFDCGWDEATTPVSSAEVAERWGDLVRWCIDAFGPRRCMFESNFPVDRVSLGYRTLWNAFKRIAACYSPAERHELFLGTAQRFYRLGHQ